MDRVEFDSIREMFPLMFQSNSKPEPSETETTSPKTTQINTSNDTVDEVSTEASTHLVLNSTLLSASSVLGDTDNFTKVADSSNIVVNSEIHNKNNINKVK
jgi:hypothetical protein